MADIILCGYQGGGKGTQATGILRNFPRFQYLETGELCRNDRVLAPIAGSGNLVEDETMTKRVLELISGNDNVLFDGFPRTRAQAISYMEEGRPAEILELEIPAEIAQERIVKRAEENRKAGKRVRADDLDPKAVKKRLKIFEDSTRPAINLMRNSGIPYHGLDGTLPVETVESEVKKIVTTLMARYGSRIAETLSTAVA